jgi:hypothetical protein
VSVSRESAVDQYLDEKINQATAEAQVVGSRSSSTRRSDLNKLRNVTRHPFAPWLAFEGLGQPARPRRAPALVHDWHPEQFGPTLDPTTNVRDKAGLGQAAQGVLGELMTRVNAAP